jgi:hypothetical protein
MMTRVAILGCGPAGLVAAHAVVSSGHDIEVEVFSRRVKSPIYGAQYLHAPIPGMTEQPARRLHVVHHGTPEEYRTKVYGEDSDVAVSHSTFPEWVDAWDLRATYDNLWREYSWRVRNVADIRPEFVRQLRDSDQYDAIISTVPAPALCYQKDKHTFHYQRVWAAGDAPTLGIRAPQVKHALRGAMIYDGRPNVPWYRVCNVWDHTTVEWPYSNTLPTLHAATVRKPISTDCDCFPTVLKLGRYGEWGKKILVHHVYQQVRDLYLLGERNAG